MKTNRRRRRDPLAALWVEWQTLTRELHAGNVELTVEVFAPLLSTYQRMRRHGVRFDPMLEALLRELTRQSLDVDESREDRGTGVEADEPPRAATLLVDWTGRPAK